jgi:hypothetical protein
MLLHVEMSAKLYSKANVSGIGFYRRYGFRKNAKMYLCQRYTGKKLKEIGLHFGIGETGVLQACRHVGKR